MGIHIPRSVMVFGGATLAGAVIGAGIGAYQPLHAGNRKHDGFDANQRDFALSQVLFGAAAGAATGAAALYLGSKTKIPQLSNLTAKEALACGGVLGALTGAAGLGSYSAVKGALD